MSIRVKKETNRVKQSQVKLSQTEGQTETVQKVFDRVKQRRRKSKKVEGMQKEENRVKQNKKGDVRIVPRCIKVRQNMFFLS